MVYRPISRGILKKRMTKSGFFPRFSYLRLTGHSSAHGIVSEFTTRETYLSDNLRIQAFLQSLEAYRTSYPYTESLLTL